MFHCVRSVCFAALLSTLPFITSCDYYADRMSVGQQQLKQGKYPQAEEAFAEATTAADDGEQLYDSLKALAAVYEARGEADKAEALRKHAVMVMGHCLEDKMNGLRPCPVREGDVALRFQGSS